MKKESCLWILWSAFSVIKTSIATTGNISISEGKIQTFICPTIYEVSWFGPPLTGIGEQTRYTNEGESNVLANVPQKDRLQVNAPPGVSNVLTILLVLKSDAGTYTCSRNGFNSSFVLQVNDPDATMITTKGSEVVIPCPHSSTINNIKWRGPPNDTIYNYPGSTILNDRDLSPEFSTRLSIDGTSGALKMNNIRLTDENYYTCDNRTVATVTKLIVLATPEPPNFINKLETRNGSDQLVVRTNEDEQIILVCQVNNGKPRPVVRWFTGWKEITGTDVNTSNIDGTVNVTSTVSLTADRSEDRVTYVCQANHITWLTARNSSVQLYLYYPPISISISNNKQVTAGDALTLKCTTGVSNPAAVITWKNGTFPLSGGPNVDQDGEYGGKIRHQNLTIICDRYMDGIVITCTAYNDRISSDGVTASSILDVRYNPIITDLNGSLTTATEGDINVKFTCEAQSKPKSNFTWKTGNNVLRTPIFQAKNQDTFLIPIISRKHHGEYTCTADNGITPPGWATLFLYVKYPPDINISASNGTTKDSNTTLLCSPFGYPDMYSFGVWLHSWPGVDKTLRSLNSSTTDKTATLILHNLTYEDSGTYTCQASNGIKATQSDQGMMTNSVYLLVKSAPKVLDISPVFRGIIRQDVMVQFNFHSNTEDNLTVTAKHINSSDPSHQGLIKPIHLDNLPVQHVMVPATGFRASLSIRVTGTEDFGEYTITVRNIIGSDSRGIHIKPASEPEKPNHFTSFNVGKHQVIFSWIPGFHGGFNQTFVIEFSLDNKTWHSAPSIDGGQRKDQFNFTVTGLSPNTRYFFRIYAYNIIGNGTYADNLLLVDTLEAIKPQEQDGPSVTAIAGGIGAAVVVIAVVAVVFICMNRRNKSSGENSNKGFQERSFATGPEYVNTAFKCDISTTEYEALQSNRTITSPYEALHDSTMKSTDISIPSDPTSSADEIFYDKLHPYRNNQGHTLRSLSLMRLDKGENQLYEN